MNEKNYDFHPFDTFDTSSLFPPFQDGIWLVIIFLQIRSYNYELAEVITFKSKILSYTSL